MIVTSKLCFLNIVTQLCPAEILLNANYFIADALEPEYVSTSTNVEYDKESGQYKRPKTDNDDDVDDRSRMLHQRFNIRYTELVLDPISCIRNAIANDPSMIISDKDRLPLYKNYLLKNDIMLSVYQNYFKERLSGNGLQFIIFNSNDTLKEFGNLICEYLAEIFGVDINFIDPKFLPIKGKEFYKGNVIDGKENITKLKDYELIIGFKGALNQTNTFGTLSNLTTWIQSHDTFEELLYIYNLIFPDDPLPRGEYTYSELCDIIAHKAVENTSFEETYNNADDVMYTSQEYIDMLMHYQEELDYDHNCTFE